MAPEPSILGDSYEDLYRQAQIHFENRAYDQAEVYYRRIYDRLSKMKESLLGRRPDLRQLLTVSTEGLAIINRRKENYEQALALYQQLLDSSDSQAHKEWQKSVAWIKIMSGDADTGLDELRALAISNADDGGMWLSLGQALFKQNEYDEAESSLKRALERKVEEPDDHYSACMALFLIYKDRKQFDKAEDYWHQAWKKIDVKPGTFYMLFQMYREAGDLDRAEYWVSKEKSPVSKNFYQGLIEQARGKTELAKSLWQKAAETKPANRQAEFDVWAEAALRVDHDPNEIISEMYLMSTQEDVLVRDVVLLAIAQIRADQGDSAHKSLQSVTGGEKAEGEVRESRLDIEMWQTFTELVPDEETREAFKEYFNTEE